MNRYNGDPKITLDEDGADMQFQGGQPVMDSGIENASLISLHTEKGWFGNSFFRKPSQKLGSKYTEEVKKSITLDQINKIRNAAEYDLAWMVNIGLASEIIASVTNPQSNNLETVILIKPPSNDPLTLILTRLGLNWIAQKLNPAYRRIRE